ncbi:TPA: hypothetical protein H1005_02255 [archaeon]|nr:hypothetical protein [Candidatus Naiadarchaeales archaeon SRR2090153.bin1042]
MISGIELVRRIKETGLSEEEIEKKVSEKLDALSGLISRDGALCIIANEMKIKIYDPNRRIKVNELTAECSGELVGKIVRVGGVREFRTESEGKVNEGKVGSFDIGDETGIIRVVAWRNRADEVANFKEGDVVRINNFYVKERNWREVHLRDSSILERCNETIDVLDIQRGSSARATIAELADGDRANLLGVVVHLFEPRFFEVCNICGSKIGIDGDKRTCREHGAVGTKMVPLINLFLDDGTGNIRIVCFRELVEKLLGLSAEEFSNIERFLSAKEDVLGKQLIVGGRAVMNKMFNRVEFIANEISEAKPEELIGELEKRGD